MFSAPKYGTSPGSGIIDRRRLLETLKGAVNHRLTLISAPPGYGKTTLVAQFTQVSPCPVIWQTIDERDRDVPNLYTHCLSTLAPVLPGIKMLDSPYRYAAGDLAALIADYLRDHLSDDILYVLDDVHHLTGAPAAELWLRTLVTLIPPPCHLILLSRTLPNLSLIEMIARGDVLAIGQEELRFTAEEIDDIGNTVLGTRPSADLIDRLEGWPAGIVLAFHPLPPEIERKVLSGGAGPEALFDALADLRLQSQPPDLRDFLLASSTLTRLTPELCGLALGLAGSTDLLAEAQARNLYLVRVSAGLTYHTLFRSFLQRQLKATAPEWFVNLHSRAARWFEEQDELEEAFDHYLEAGLSDQAMRIADYTAYAFFAQGRTETLLDWSAKLKALGIDVPRLLHRCAAIHTERYDYPTADAELDAAQAAFAAQGDEDGLADVQLQQAAIKLQRSEYSAAVDCVADLVEHSPGPNNVRGRALNTLGFAYVQIGEVETAVRELEAARPLFRSYADAYSQSHFLQNLAVAYWRRGRLTDALSALHEVVALRRSLGSAGPLAAALNNLGYYYNQFGDYKQAMVALQEGLNAIERVPNRRSESYLLLNLADAHRNRGAFDEARQGYHQALDVLGNSEPALRCTILTNVSTLHRWQGQLSEAVALADEAAALAVKHQISMESSAAQMVLWAARAECGEAEQALVALEQIADELNRKGEQFALLQALGLCASVAVMLSRKPAVEGHLQAALKLAATIGTAQPLVVEILHAPPLEAYIRHNGSRFEQLIRSLERLYADQVQPVDGQAAGGRLSTAITYSLRALTLGQEKIKRDGKLIQSGDWRPAARDLFFYLLFEGPADREQVGLAFWEDASPKQIRANFHVTVHRIRQALGENAITHQDGAYGVNPEIDLWCDAQELEKLASQARLLPPHDARTEDLWRRAVGLYQGEFLPSLDADWAIRYRESLGELYMEALMGLGECARVRRDFREALAIFKRALDLDPYREEFHREIMRCHAARGAILKVREQLRDLQALLRRDLDTDPSRETIALARSLLKKDPFYSES